MAEFVHLHLHTEYSLLDGHSRIDPLLARAADLGMGAIGVTDHGAMYGVVEFYKKALRGHGMRPILGVEAYQAMRRHTDRDPRLDNTAYHLTLLARDDEGYRNLVRLITTAHLDGFYYRPRIDKELLAAHSRGVICLSGCMQSEICQRLLAGDEAGARQAAGAFRDLFEPGAFFLELQNQGIEEQKGLMRSLIQLARDLDLPLVATNDVHYVAPEDAEAQDALMCIQMGKTLSDPDRPKLGDVPQFYLKSAEEMAAIFAELPQAIRNTREIADRCHVTIELDQPKLPEFPVPAGFTPQAYLRHLCERGVGRLYPVITREIEERLDYELSVIGKMGYAPYFLIVQDFVNFARGRAIYTTVRGSAAGSLVLYACGVTDVDPLAYKLPFDRFLNLERYTLPDIDVDFMDTRRDEVIRYVMQKYGEDHVAQIITFGTMKARQAVRDVGRAMGMSYGDVDRIAKRIPQTATLQEALETDPDLVKMTEDNEQVKKLVDLARRMEGVSRNAGTHAAGVIISRDPLADSVPLTRGKDDVVMTQFDMTSVADIGLLKFDFLGLTYLTILDAAVRIIHEKRGVAIDLQKLPLDDAKTYALLSSGETTGVFQLESSGMRRYLMELRPSDIQDIMVMVALFRPGPMANIPSYIRRKHGKEKVTYLHPVLEPVLKDTYGVMVYQEDIMTVAQAMAGYTLAEADVLCYAIRKKIKDKLLAQREKFVAGARAQNIPKETVDKVFEQFEPFARYGFNRAHAACYGLIAYYTAYLKANYPAEYMTAVLTADSGNLDRIGLDVEECRRMGVSVLPPDVNESESGFTAVNPTTIRFGLATIKNVGIGAVDDVMRARRDGGPFRSLYDFCVRVDGRLVTKRVIESLIKGGAFDSLGSRAALLAGLDGAVDFGARRARSKDEAQTGLFQFSAEEEAPPPLPDAEPFGERETLAMEREMLGLYLTGHPVRSWQAQLERKTRHRIADLSGMNDREEVVVGGIVTHFKPMVTKQSGARMAVITLEDLSGAVETMVWPKTFERTGEALTKDAVVVVRGRVDVTDARVKLLADEVTPIEEAADDGGRGNGSNGSNGGRGNGGNGGARGKALHVRVSTAEEIIQLSDFLQGRTGDRAAFAHVQTMKGESVHRLRRGLPATDEFRRELEAILGDGAVWEE